MTLMEQIQALSDAVGTPGDELEVRKKIMSLLPDDCTRRTDILGNLLVEKKGAQTPAKPIMISAHMDEPGLMVESADLTGGVKFSISGEIDMQILPGRRVWVLSKGERLPGVIGIKPVHVLKGSEIESSVSADDLFIDLGCERKEETNKLTSPGDSVAFRGETGPFGDRLIRGRALDSRSGCAVLLSLLEQDLPFDITAVFTVQRETGSIGMKTAVFQVQPGAAVILESFPAADHPVLGAKKESPKLGEGPVISLREQRYFFDKELFFQCRELAQQEEIPVQIKSAAFGTGDGAAAQTSGNGTRVLELGIPSRYALTPCCIQSLKDLESLSALLLPLIQMLGEKMS